VTGRGVFILRIKGKEWKTCERASTFLTLTIPKSISQHCLLLLQLPLGLTISNPLPVDSISYDPQSSLLFASFKYTGKDYEADMASMRTHEPTKKWWAMTDKYQQSVNEGAVSSELGGTVGKDGRRVPSWWKGVEEVFHMA